MWDSIIGGVGGLLGGAVSGLLNKQKSQETPIQGKQRQLIDQLLQSLGGNGPYSNLFSANDADFERSFAEPARARFRNYTTPQIQQGYIASGLQNSTGLQDTLARAGVDMDQLLNQQYMDYQNQALNRQSNAIGSILGQSPGAMPAQSNWDAIKGGIGSYLNNFSFGMDIQDILDSFGNPSSSQMPQMPQRKGFERENQMYNRYIGGNL